MQKSVTHVLTCCLLNKPIAVLKFSLLSPSSLLKLPFLLIMPSTRAHSLWNLRNYLHCKRQNYSFISNKNFFQALFQTLPKTKSVLIFFKFAHPCFLFCLWCYLLGSFSNDDGDGKQDIKKAIGLLCKTTTLHVHHAFLYISLPSLHDYDVKMPNCKFYGGSKQATTNLFFPF